MPTGEQPIRAAEVVGALSLATDLGTGQPLEHALRTAALEYVFARWDGRGFPDTSGDALPLPIRLLHVARDISLFLTAAGTDEARAVVERRTGTAYDPRLAELAVRNFGELLAELDEA